MLLVCKVIIAAAHFPGMSGIDITKVQYTFRAALQPSPKIVHLTDTSTDRREVDLDVPWKLGMAALSAGTNG